MERCCEAIAAGLSIGLDAACCRCTTRVAGHWCTAARRRSAWTGESWAVSWLVALGVLDSEGLPHAVLGRGRRQAGDEVIAGLRHAEVEADGLLGQVLVAGLAG